MKMTDKPMALLFPDCVAICKYWLLWREENRRFQTKHCQSKDNKLKPLMTPGPGFQLRPGHTWWEARAITALLPLLPYPCYCDIFHTLFSSVLSDTLFLFQVKHASFTDLIVTMTAHFLVHVYINAKHDTLMPNSPTEHTEY